MLFVTKMPKRRYRKRSRRKRKRKTKRKSFIPLLLGNSHVCRMKYTTGFVLDPAAGAITSRVFSAGGVTDCASSTGGLQPVLGFDQMNAFFSQYKVLGSKIIYTYVPIATTNAVPGVFGVFLDDDTNLNYGSCQTVLQNQQQKNLTIKMCGSTLYNQNKMPRDIATYSLRKETRGNNTSQGDLIGDVAANPVANKWYQCWMGSPDISNDPGPSHFIITIEYIVQWFNKTNVLET